MGDGGNDDGGGDMQLSVTSGLKDLAILGHEWVILEPRSNKELVDV